MVKENQPKLAKLFILGVMFVVFCLAQITAVFSPVPLIVSALSFGRKKHHLISIICLSIILGICFYFKSFEIFIVAFISYMISVLVSEVIMKGIRPMKAILSLGSSIILLSFGFFGYSISQGFSVDSYIEDSIKKTELIFNERIKSNSSDVSSSEIQKLKIDEFFKDTKKSIPEVKKRFPLFYIGFVFLSLWGIFYFILKSYHLYSKPEFIKHSEESLKNFKMSDYFIFPVAIGLALLLFGEKLGPEYKYFGEVGLFLMGIFYFMQGFGILMTYFDRFGLQGIFRSLILILVIFFSPMFLCSLGLFDTWFDFRKKNKIKRKKV